MTLPGFERPIVLPVIFYCFDFVKPITLLSKSGLRTNIFPSFFICTHFVLCVRNILSFYIYFRDPFLLHS